MAGQYGFGGAVGLNNSNQFGTNLAGKAGGPLTSVRVKSIVLDQYHPRFKELGEWNGLGTIEYEFVNAPANSDNVFPTARPVFPNSKTFPLVNEIVFVASLPSTEIGKSASNTQAYYISVVSLWNHPHHNGYPLFSNKLPPSQEKDYIQSEAGSVRRVTDQSTEIFLGKTFFERSDIKPLLPYEGDVIHEGRWGNSIRLGSTVSGTNNPNLWSSAGINGDPIVIIRNGQNPNLDTEGWVPTLENINNDLSSIYLGSTQKLPIQAASIKYDSYATPPTAPQEYEGPQVMVTSNRLVFNASKDHLLLSSANSVGLNGLVSVNVDTDSFNVSAKTIYLGTKNDTDSQPILLGKDTVTALKDAIDAITGVLDQLAVLVSLPPGAPFGPLNMVSKASSLDLKTIQSNLDLLLSDRVNVVNSKVQVNSPFQAPEPPAPVTIITPENVNTAEVTPDGNVVVENVEYPTQTESGSLDLEPSSSIPSELSSSISASVPVSASVISQPDFEVDADLFGDFTFVDTEPELPEIIPLADPPVVTDPIPQTSGSTPVTTNPEGYTTKELASAYGGKTVFVIPNNFSDPGSICLVLGGFPSSKYGGNFMFKEFKKANESLFNTKAFIFMDWEYGASSNAKAKQVIAQNYPNLTIKSLVCFSKSGESTTAFAATTEGKGYKVIGWCDPSPGYLPSGNYSNNNVMILTTNPWNENYYKNRIPKLKQKISSDGGSVTSELMNHLKYPEVWFKRYGNLC